ncbi:MAG: peptidase S16 [Gammaproteobacteria bacterium]|nr:peptidase S16 [Gammaproteobacteria bacterium]
MAGVELPLFPLNTVLFPRGPLPLRIFEPRYVDMVRRCMREESCFGVVLLQGGGETGPVSGVASVGTSARIVDFNLLKDGLLGITCRGERRFRVRRVWRQDDGLNMGEVEWIDPTGAGTPAVAVPPEHRHLAELLRRVLPELGEVYAGVEPRFEDAAWVGARLVEILPVGLADKQAFLEMDDPLERLAVLSPLIRRPDEDAQDA